ncbi:hypothetical protein EDB85DRAFT_538820 [Lactarius pseudohatsudake]|nr:hypothetical protein EDB85DRAFT_538820 [Lactarius pseudohatsudake]
MTTSELTLSSLAWLTVSATTRDIPSAVSGQPSVGNGKMKGHYICTLRKISDEVDVVLPVLVAPDTTGAAASWSRSRCKLENKQLVGPSPHDPNDVLPLRGPSPLAQHQRSPLLFQVVHETSGARRFIVGRRQSNLIHYP